MYILLNISIYLFIYEQFNQLSKTKIFQTDPISKYEWKQIHLLYIAQFYLLCNCDGLITNGHGWFFSCCLYENYLGSFKYSLSPNVQHASTTIGVKKMSDLLRRQNPWLVFEMSCKFFCWTKGFCCHKMSLSAKQSSYVTQKQFFS